MPPLHYIGPSVDWTPKIQKLIELCFWPCTYGIALCIVFIYSKQITICL